MKKFLLIFIFLSCFYSPLFATGETSSGIIPGQIWYSQNNLIEGDTVNIYKAVWNGEVNSLSVKVEFYDKNVILGTRDVILKPSELNEIQKSTFYGQLAYKYISQGPGSFGKHFLLGVLRSFTSLETYRVVDWLQLRKTI